MDTSVPVIGYETLFHITRAVSLIRDPRQVFLITAEGDTHALKIEGCDLLLFNPKEETRGFRESQGTRREYHPDEDHIRTLRSIGDALRDGEPVAVFDLADEQWMPYVEAHLEEEAPSMLSVPIVIGSTAMGFLRILTAEPRELVLNDSHFIAAARVAGMNSEMGRIDQCLQESMALQS